MARDAGVDTGSVTRWVERHGYARHCRTWGRDLLLPLPAVRLYLTGHVPRARSDEGRPGRGVESRP